MDLSDPVERRAWAHYKAHRRGWNPSSTGQHDPYDADLTEPPYRAPTLPDRNDPCPCGSGEKYKRCCIDRPPRVVRPRARLGRWLVLWIAVALAIGTIAKFV